MINKVFATITSFILGSSSVVGLPTPIDVTSDDLVFINQALSDQRNYDEDVVSFLAGATTNVTLSYQNSVIMLDAGNAAKNSGSNPSIDLYTEKCLIKRSLLASTSSTNTPAQTQRNDTVLRLFTTWTNSIGKKMAAMTVGAFLDCDIPFEATTSITLGKATLTSQLFAGTLQSDKQRVCIIAIIRLKV